MVGCMCHVANLAAQAFLKHESKRAIRPYQRIQLIAHFSDRLFRWDYPEDDCSNIPSIRVIGESEPLVMTGNEVEQDKEDDSQLAEDGDVMQGDFEDDDATTDEETSVSI